MCDCSQEVNGEEEFKEITCKWLYSSLKVLRKKYSEGLDWEICKCDNQ